MDGKKISFSFTKTKKVEKPVTVERKDYIECLEEKSIKVVGGEPVEEKAPLVIAMKPNTLITAERLRQIADEVEKAVEETPEPQETVPGIAAPVENETLDQMAVRELLQQAKKEIKVHTEMLTVAVPTGPILDGKKESTLEDYVAIPVQDFGMAMLRGMGWTASKEQQQKLKVPELRPKGLGLGADKVIKENQKKNAAKNKDEELAIIRNAFVKVTMGKYSGCYGKVVSLDDDNGRVMVDIPIKKETVSLSEFMMQAVSKSEFDKQSKVINAASYEEYKRTEQGKSQRDSPNAREREATSSKKQDLTTKKYDYNHSRNRDKESSNGRSKVKERRHRSSSSSPDRSSRRRGNEGKKYSSNESLSSQSDYEQRKKHKKERRRHSSESNSSDEKHRKEKKKDSLEKKRDIDKKRKGKKKKRDRDRSPHYKKHKK